MANTSIYELYSIDCDTTGGWNTVTESDHHPDSNPRSSYATSQSLLERVQSQDQEAWNRLVYIFSPLVYHVCAKWKVTGADAEDVVQDVFQAVAASIAEYQVARDGKRAPFRCWLGGIIHHKLGDRHRRQVRQPQAEGGSAAHERLQELPAPKALLPAEDLSATSGVCQRALHLLRDEFEPQTWQAFWRTAVDGQPATAVAIELGMSAAAIRKAKSRILHRLRIELGDLFE
jgi:RNA polymerase sigma-70 factor (ECF subfamily)